jgi:hypothetical protein
MGTVAAVERPHYQLGQKLVSRPLGSGASSGLRCDQLIQHQIDVFLRKAQSREVSLNKQPLQVLVDRSDFDLPHARSPRRQTFLDTPHRRESIAESQQNTPLSENPADDRVSRFDQDHI